MQETIDVFNEIDCLYVTYDYYCFNTDIYVGNDQFMMSNSNLTHEQREELYFETKKKVNKI